MGCNGHLRAYAYVRVYVYVYVLYAMESASPCSTDEIRVLAQWHKQTARLAECDVLLDVLLPAIDGGGEKKREQWPLSSYTLTRFVHTRLLANIRLMHTHPLRARVCVHKTSG